MKHLVAFGRFWYDFVVGDDWTIAVGVVAAVAVTAVTAHRGYAAWPILPLAVAGLLVWSVWRVRPSRPPTAVRPSTGPGTTDRGPTPEQPVDGWPGDAGAGAG